MGRFYCDNLVIRDENARERMFRGCNCCSKAAGSLADDINCFLSQFDDMIKCGVNIIRLGVTWAAIEPQEGCFSNENIALIKSFVKKCEENSIYVMLDMHQDLYSEYFHGDGAPQWAVSKQRESKKPFAVWAEGYFYMDGVQGAFSDFWHNENAVQDKFIRAWKYYANSFKDCENIIGLDYFNEPYIDKNGRQLFLQLISNVMEIAFGSPLQLEKYFKNHSDKAAFARAALRIAARVGSIKRLKKLRDTMDCGDNFHAAVAPLAKYTAGFNSEYYKPFFDKISAKAGIDGTFNFFEHNYFSNLGIEFDIETKPSYVYSPHAYDIFVDSPLYDKYSSNGRVGAILSTIRQNQLKMNTPVIFGEYGGGSTGEEWIKHIDFIMGEFEKYHWSSIYWHLDFNNEKLTGVFNRPYPVAVAGNITEIKTFSKNRRFHLKWETPADFDMSAATQIFVPGQGIREYDSAVGVNEIEIDY